MLQMGRVLFAVSLVVSAMVRLLVTFMLMNRCLVVVCCVVARFTTQGAVSETVTSCRLQVTWSSKNLLATLVQAVGGAVMTLLSVWFLASPLFAVGLNGFMRR